MTSLATLYFLFQVYPWISRLVFSVHLSPSVTRSGTCYGLVLGPGTPSYKRDSVNLCASQFHEGRYDQASGSVESMRFLAFLFLFLNLLNDHFLLMVL